eukprot:TRINITY_DN18403_c0_g1_i9.p2 TRINITY_DN18403_c0_g1~~TRINITY_DN18403_c0_g1_i9.p2  ORF type:complete len:112 (+),score=27.33 TRINITY_DN18403_c0_g1_i9:523-858(+)
MNTLHKQWLDRVLDSAVLAVLASGSLAEADKPLATSLRQYVASAVAEGQRVLKGRSKTGANGEDGAEEGDEEDDGDRTRSESEPPILSLQRGMEGCRPRPGFSHVGASEEH